MSKVCHSIAMARRKWLKNSVLVEGVNLIFLYQEYCYLSATWFYNTKGIGNEVSFHNFVSSYCKTIFENLNFFVFKVQAQNCQILELRLDFIGNGLLYLTEYHDGWVWEVIYIHIGICPCIYRINFLIYTINV